MELREVPFHPQEKHHCGPASLLTVLEASGVGSSYDAVVDRVFVPGLEGSLQAEMTAAARAFGRIAYVVPPEPALVLAEVDAGRPVLVLLNLGLPKVPAWHYAVVVGFDPVRNRILLRSGRSERVEHKAPTWLRRWDWAGRWAVVLLRPGEWPAEVDKPRMLAALAAFEESGDPEVVGEAWRVAASHWPEEPLPWLGIGNAAYRRGDGEGARNAYQRVLEIDAEHLPARLNLAISLDDDGRPCAALAALGAFADPEHPLEETRRSLEARLRLQCPDG